MRARASPFVPGVSAVHGHQHDAARAWTSGTYHTCCTVDSASWPSMCRCIWSRENMDQHKGRLKRDPRCRAGRWQKRTRGKAATGPSPWRPARLARLSTRRAASATAAWPPWRHTSRGEPACSSTSWSSWFRCTCRRVTRCRRSSRASGARPPPGLQLLPQGQCVDVHNAMFMQMHQNNRGASSA